MNQVQELEQAILARAERLAAEYHERAQRKRDGILREAAERLRLRERREETIAKTLGERTFRRQVQANELKMQSHIDRVRWNLVTDVEHGLRDRMEGLMADETAYLASLEAYLKHAATQIECDELVAELNVVDHVRVSKRWEELAAAAAPGKSLRLAPEAIDTLGGVRVTSADGRTRVDHTFEGRLERLRNRIRQVILERLLPGGLDTGPLFGG